MHWTNFDTVPPPKAGTYLVSGQGLVGQARWMPNNRRWVFPSAHMAFLVTHWQPMPLPAPVA